METYYVVIQNLTASQNETEIPKNGSLELRFAISQGLTYASPSIIISFLLCFLSITVNVCGLLGIYYAPTSGIYSQTYRLRLVTNLSITDILISLCIPAYNIHTQSQPMDENCMYQCVEVFLRALIMTTFVITLLNLLGMAVDHFVAILKPLRYHDIINNHNSFKMIVIFWTIAILVGFSDFAIAAIEYAAKDTTSQFTNKNVSNETGNTSMNLQMTVVTPCSQKYCGLALTNEYMVEFIMYPIIIICFAGMTFIYVRIYREVLGIQRRAPAHQRDESSNKKALMTTMIILGSFILCWFPYILYDIGILIQLQVDSSKIYHSFGDLITLNHYLFNLMLLNALIDPIIYSTRTMEVRKGLKRFSRRLSGSLGCTISRAKTLNSHNSTLFRSSIPSSTSNTILTHTRPDSRLLGRSSSSIDCESKM